MTRSRAIALAFDEILLRTLWPVVLVALLGIWVLGELDRLRNRELRERTAKLEAEVEVNRLRGEVERLRGEVERLRGEGLSQHPTPPIDEANPNESQANGEQA